MKTTDAKMWVVEFETKDGMFHPLRISKFNGLLNKKEAREEAKKYLARNKNWLKRISSISVL